MVCSNHLGLVDLLLCWVLLELLQCCCSLRLALASYSLPDAFSSSWLGLEACLLLQQLLGLASDMVLVLVVPDVLGVLLNSSGWMW